MSKSTLSTSTSFWRTWTNALQLSLFSALLMLGTTSTLYGQCPPEEPPQAPYLVDWEGLSNGNNSFSFPNCWSAGSSTPYWQIEDANTGSSDTGPAVDNTTGTTSGKYIFLETSSGTTGAVNTLVSPDISLDNLSALRELTFFYHMYGATMGSLVVDIFNGTSYDTVFTIAGEQHFSLTDSWTKATVSLAAYSGAVHFRFHGTRGSSYTGDMALDDIFIADPPACPEPTNLLLTAVTGNSADFSWTPGTGAATSWTVEYGLAGFTLGTGSTMVVSSATASLTGLSSYSDYTAYVYESCVGSAAMSNQSSALSISTPIVPDWSENMDTWTSSVWSSGWYEADGAIRSDTTAFTSTTSSGWFLDGMANNGTTGAMRNYVSRSSSLAYSEWLITPSIDLGIGGGYELRFAAALTSSSSTLPSTMGFDDSICIVISTDNGATWNRSGILRTFTEADALSNIPAYYSLSLGAYSGAVKLGFYSQSTTFVSGTETGAYEFFVDEVTVRTPPACADPIGLVASGVSNASAILSWISPGTAFELEYGAQGFAVGTGSIITPTDTFTAVAGLTGNTTYDFYVRQDCGMAGLSPDFGPVAVTTQCDGATTWFEDMDTYSSGSTTLPACWSKIGADGSFYVISNTASSSAPNSFYIYGSTTLPPTGTLSPVNNLGAGTHRLVFQGRSGSTSYSKALRVGYVTDLNDAATFVKLDSAVVSGTTMSEYTVPVSIGAPAGAILAVQLSSNANGSMYIDDVSWEAIPTCPRIVDLSASASSAVSAMMNWNEGGSESMWDVHVVASGAAAPMGLGTVVTDTFYTATGLSVPNVYDVYIRSICGAGDTSLSRMISVAVDYCASNATSTADSRIESVTIGTDSVIGNLPGVCSVYSDLRGAVSFSLQYAIPSPIEVEYGTCGGNFGSYAKVYVDFNNDLVFDEATELIAEGSTAFGAPLVTNTNMPISGVVGNTVMRVVMRESGSTTSTLACGTYSYGETQDFTVSVAAPPACAPPANVDDIFTYGNQTTLAWSSGESAFEIEYDSTGFVQGSSNNALVSVSNDTMTTITGLFTQTSYDYYIRTQCGAVYSPWVGPYTFTTTVSCPAPSNFGGVVGSTFASITWQSNGLNSDYFYILDSAGVTTTTGTILSGTGDSAYVSGLFPNTDYSLFVANNCGADTSSWSSAINFTTGCVTFTAPYSQNFDSEATNLIGAVDCWNLGVSPTVSNLFWRTNINSTGSGSTGPASDNSGSGTYIYLETSSTADDTAMAQSPVINIDALANPELSFYYHMYGASMGTLRVDIWNGSSWDIGVWSLSGQQQVNSGDAWLLASISLATYSGDIAVRFAGNRNGSYTGDMALDDFSIINASPCPFPTGLSAAGTSSTTIDLAWTSGSVSTTAWVVEMIPGDPLMASSMVLLNTTTATISGLMAYSDYAFRVADICASGDTSWFTPNTSATTTRAPYWLEDFAVSPTSASQGWYERDGKLSDSTVFTTSTFSTWSTDGMANNGFSGAYRVNFPTSTSTYYEWVMSPSIDLGTSMNYELRWQAALTTSSGTVDGALSPDDSISVVISTDNGTTWSRSGVLAVQDMNSGLNATASIYSVSLAAYSGAVKIGFYMQSDAASTSANDYFIDNVEIRDIPSCADVLNNIANSSNVTGTTALITWGANGVSNFDVEYGAAGYTPGMGTLASTTDTFMMLTGLSGATNYDVVVRQNCGGGDLGSWSYPTSFITNVVPDWIEGFDATYTSTPGWYEGKGEISDSTVFTSTSSMWGNDQFANISGGSDAAKMNLYSTNRFEWMFTPTIEIPDNGSVYELSFDLGMTEYANTSEAIMGIDDTVMVVISTDNGTTWSRSNVVYMIHQGNKPAGVSSWPVSVALMGYTGTIQIGFYTESTVSNEDIDVSVDNVAITENCNLAPMAITGVNFVSAPAQYNVQYTINGGDLYILQTREVGTDTWFTPKSWKNPVDTAQNFLAKRPGVDNEVRLGARVDGNFYFSCPMTFAAACKPMTVSAIELVVPFCAGDSAQLKAIASGGFKAKTFLWNTGETTRFIYGQQGLTYQVVVTDLAGCSDSASVTASLVGSPYTPGNFSLSKPNAVTFVTSWDAPSLGTGVSLIGYRMQYRQAGVGASWVTSSLLTATTATVDFTGSCDPSANYEFVVFARVNDNGTVYNTPVSCKERKFYNGSGGCAAKSGDINGSSASLNGITVYPNPTNNMLNVGINSETTTLQLLDMNGKVLFSQEFEGQAEANINMSDFAAGVYMLNVTNATGIYQERVIKN